MSIDFLKNLASQKKAQGAAGNGNATNKNWTRVSELDRARELQALEEIKKREEDQHKKLVLKMKNMEQSYSGVHVEDVEEIVDKCVKKFKKNPTVNDKNQEDGGIAGNENEDA